MIRRKRLGAYLRTLRLEAGLTGAQLAHVLGWSESKVSRIETARVGLSLQDAMQCAEQLQLRDAKRSKFLALAEDVSNTRGWWQAYRSVVTTEQQMLADIESGASQIAFYASVLIPGLVQAAEYARHVLGWYRDLDIGTDDIESAVAIRMERQRVLVGRDPLQLKLLVEESLLRRHVAPGPVIVAQLQKLISISRLPNVSMRVMPLYRSDNALTPPPAHAFQLIEFRDLDDPPVIEVETLVDNRYFHEEDRINHYRTLFNRLWSSAIPEGPSREFCVRLCRSIAEKQ